MWLQVEILEEFKCVFNKLKPELKLAVVFATPPKPHFAYASWVLHLEYNLSTGGERAAHCLQGVEMRVGDGVAGAAGLLAF